MIMPAIDFATTLIFAPTGALAASRKQMGMIGHM